ncbi:MAG: ROK family protein [Lachnospiraceae bacterium]|nr:ROK family protein [Lachnospiraceae bacterium]
MKIYGALEAGGTKMVCATGLADGTILEQTSIPTTTPDDTVEKIADFFSDKGIVSLGIATFGPVDVKKGSPTYGCILNTPKLAWQNYNLLSALKKRISVPMEIDTDVNGSCLGELTFGCAKGLDSVIYITIGTGVGVGIAINGKLMHGMLHPEAGHILLNKHPDDPYPGKCPFHPNCMEGLCAGPAIEERYGKPAFELSDRQDVWELEAYYIAQAIVDFVCTLSPRKVILGGGVMHQEQLFPLIRKKTKELLNGYIETAELADMENYIVPASLHDDQGIMGAVQLAKWAENGAD